MKRYLYTITFLILIIAASGCITNGESQTKHYSNGEISFDYPGTWNMANGTGKSEIVSFSDSGKSFNVTVSKIPIPPGYSLKDNFQLNSAEDNKFKLVSKKNYTINRMDAYEYYYKLNSTEEQNRKEIWFQKNNQLYSIVYTGSSAALDIKSDSGLMINSINSRNTFNTLINSFTINNTETEYKNKYTGWAEIIIPSIHADWLITSNSVNTADSVYHLPNSYYPGEKGQMALMGHHTTHHAPFLNINKLKAGDSLIIKDYVTRKKYTYQVTSNGDIRWGVKGVSIDYQSTEEPELLLVTCYPPGFSQAAWIVHSKLVSVQPLS